MSISANIRARREALGLDLRAVATISGVSTERLDAIEQGAQLSVRELDAVAAALAVEPGVLRASSEDADVRWSAARFLMGGGAGGTIPPTDVRTLARVAEAARLHAFLRTLLGEPRSAVERLRRVRAIDRRREVWKSGHALGAAARAALDVGPGPIASVQGLLEARGVLVVSVKLDMTDIHGASLFEAGATPTIVLNARSQRGKGRLSRRSVLAHELCHLLHDSTMQRDLVTIVSRRGDLSEVEVRANSFAPSFLAPADLVATGGGAEARTGRALVLGLASKWGFTPRAATRYALRLGYITEKVADTLEHGGLTLAPRGFEPDLPRLSPSSIGLDVVTSMVGRSALGDLAIRAAQLDLISARRAAEILTFA